MNTLSKRRISAGLTALAIGVVGIPMLPGPAAEAAFPGENGLIAFHDSGDVWVMNPDGTDRQNLTGSDGASAGLIPDPPAWSPDGSRIAFTGGGGRSGNDVFVMNADGTGSENLTNNDATAGRPTFSPDGTQIAFQSHPGSGVNNIIVMNADGTDPHALTTPDTQDRSPAWSPDGSRIAFARYVSGNYDVFVMNADGTEPENLTNDPDTLQSYPSWSPDGSRIAFVGNRVVGGGGREVWVMDADGSNLQGLGNEPSIIQSPPAWSPDGTQIAFGGVNTIYVMDADGSNLREIGPGQVPNWQPLPVTPVAEDDFYGDLPRDTIISVSSVLLNDIGDDLTAKLETDAGLGELDLADDGMFTYTLADPATPETADTFSYQACGPSGVCSDPATVTLAFEDPSEAAATTVTLTSDPAEPVEGDDVTLTATVEADSEVDAEPTGTVEFFDGDDSLGTAELASPATLTVSDLAAGTHNVTARYGGDDTFAPAVSDPVTVTIAEQNATDPTDSLPDTGLDVAGLTGLAAMLAVGGLGLLLVRRRRTRSGLT